MDFDGHLTPGCRELEEGPGDVALDPAELVVVRRLNELPGIKCSLPDGAFYAFFDVSFYFGKTLGGRKITDSMSFCAAALEVGHVNLVQGSAFGMEGFARLSFATSRDMINKGVDRLGAFCRGRRRLLRRAHLETATRPRYG